MDLIQAVESIIRISCLIALFAFLNKFERIIEKIENNIILITQQQTRIEEELKQIKSNTKKED